MYPYRAKSFLIVLIAIFCTKSFAQTSTTSSPLTERENIPYSKYGIGTLQNSGGIVMQGMGDISSAYKNDYIMNTDNPASYASLKLTTYEGGLKASLNTLSSGSYNYTTGTANLAYMNIGIPVGKKAGICIGMKQMSNVFYNTTDTTYSAWGKTQGLYSGSGSLNFLYLGVAYRFGDLSLGVNAGYLFGQIRNSVVLNNIDTITTVYNSDFSKFNNIGGLYWKVGAIYEKSLKKNLDLRIGATFTMKQTIGNNLTEYWTSSYSLADSLILDTAYRAPGVNGNIVMPMSYSLGVQLARADNWNVGVEYAATHWSQYTNFGNADSLTDAYKISIGAELLPSVSNMRNYWSRVTYRAGLYYGRDNVYLNGSFQNFYGFTAGVSLPFKRSFSHIHAAIDMGSLSSSNSSLIKQNYIRLLLGFTFNDKWFVKRKYD